MHRADVQNRHGHTQGGKVKQACTLTNYTRLLLREQRQQREQHWKDPRVLLEVLADEVQDGLSKAGLPVHLAIAALVEVVGERRSGQDFRGKAGRLKGNG